MMSRMVGWVMSKKKNWRTIPHVSSYMDRNRRCEVCGGTDRLDIHHIHPKSLSKSYPGEDIHETANLVVVCMGCHSLYHDVMGQLPSTKGWHRKTNAKNLRKLITKTDNPKFSLMAPAYVKDAYLEAAFKGEGEDEDTQ